MTPSAVVTPDGPRVRTMTERLEEALELGYLTARRGEHTLRTRYTRSATAAQGFFVVVAPRRRYASIDADYSGRRGRRLNAAGHAAAVDMFRAYLRAAFADGYRGGAVFGSYGCTTVRIEDAPEAAARLVALYRDPTMTDVESWAP